jgi:hypothetical protein
MVVSNPIAGKGQLALPLGWAARGEADKFLIADCNHTAFDLIAGAQDWQASGAILIGPPRSGKSKLGAHVAGQGQAAFIDDADALADEALFHQWNRARDAGLAPLLAATKPPGAWGVTLPDLQSRLGGAVLATIGEPDDAFLAALIRYHLGLLGGSIADEALDYIIPRLHRTHFMAEHFATEANAAALAGRRAITLPLVRDLLTGWNASAQLSLDDDL